MNDPHDEALDAREREELRAIVSLLRNLPDPEPPETLMQRVLERVAAREARPVVVRAVFRVGQGLAEPGGALLAAGIACLLVFVSLGPLPSFLRMGDAAPPRLAENEGSGSVSSQPVVGGRQPAPAVVVNPQFVGLFNSYPQAPQPRVRLDRVQAPMFDRADRGLDQQLNRLLLDPTAYCQRLERVPQRDALIARLANRSAERGDAIEVALRVRQASHPLGKLVADRLMQAAFVQRISPR